jgi:hypothetical protein
MLFHPFFIKITILTGPFALVIRARRNLILHRYDLRLQGSEFTQITAEISNFIPQSVSSSLSLNFIIV